MIPSEMFAIAGGDDDYTIPNSLRFRSSASTYASRAMASAGNRQLWTWSGWVKRGTLSVINGVFGAAGSASGSEYIRFSTTDKLELYDGISAVALFTTDAAFRDVAAWYHVVVNYDSSNTVANERVRVYVNGVRQSGTIYAIAAGRNSYVNNAANHSVGSAIFTGGPAAGTYLDGYLANVYFIDGQAVSPESFGKFSTKTGQWTSSSYSGTFGANGFFLDFTDFSSVAALGYDKSGNGINFTPTNISLTAGVTYDSMVDSPTNNFSTINAVYSSVASVDNGSLTGTSSTYLPSTMTVPLTGKWYFELTWLSGAIPAGASMELGFGWRDTNVFTGEGLRIMRQLDASGTVTSYYAIFNGVGENSTPLYGFTLNTVFGFAVDCDNSSVSLYKDGVFVKTFTSMTRTKDLYIMAQRGGNAFTYGARFNFGQHPFNYAIPAGYQKLCAQNLPTPSIIRGETGFDVATYTGNGGNLQIGEYQFPRPNYLINNSLRFRGVNSYLNRVPAAASNRQTWTWSGWVKKADLGVHGTLFEGGTTVNDFSRIAINATDEIEFDDYVANVYATRMISTLKIRRPSEYVHIVVAYDTTQATASDRIKIYVNGSLITTYNTSNYPNLNANSYINSTLTHWVGRGAGGNYTEGYLAEVNFVDGQRLSATDFGEFDANGFWIPKAYTGTYGTNGFYLPFSDNSSLTSGSNVGLGKDFSGNGNYWNTNNISITADSTYDSMTDSPTNNTATLNSLISSGNGTSVPFNAGLSFSWSHATSVTKFYAASLSAKMKQYFEVVLTAQTFTGSATSLVVRFENSVGVISIYNYNNANLIVTAYGVTIGTYTLLALNEVLGVAVDENGSVQFYRNGTLFHTVNNTIPYDILFIGGGTQSTGTLHVNFGQRPFSYTPPTGYNMLSIPNIAEYAYDLESPDLVWIKSRSAATNHMLFDISRGVGNYLSSNLTAAQVSDPNSLIGFNKNGFYLGNNAAVNTLNNTYVAWMWKKSAALGFDIVNFTKVGSTVESFNHALGVPPKMMIVKSGNAGTGSWSVYHEALGNTKDIILNSNAAAVTAVTWNNTSPTSTTFTLGTNWTSSTPNHVAYLFAEVDGYSKFSSYDGNALADGPFIYTGFKPRFILVKCATAVGSWGIFDVQRDTFNIVNNQLVAEATTVESTATAAMDILSNGFKLKTSTFFNAAQTYVFAAFAESPFKYATAR